MTRNEHEHTINGVKGRMLNVHEPQMVRGRLVYRNQTWKSISRPISGYGAGGQFRVTIRFDDECQNGHQTFSITAYVTTPASIRRGDIKAGGCLHDDITHVFPELAPLIKWHLVSTDGPMHYIANTVYHAGDRDCHGLRLGERRQIRNGSTGQLCWILESDVDLPRYVDSDTPPVETATLRYVPMERIGEGKERDLDAARRSACWPEATDAELCAEPDDLTHILRARLPQLLADFRADMERIGMLWEPGEGVQRAN